MLMRRKLSAARKRACRLHSLHNAALSGGDRERHSDNTKNHDNYPTS